MRAQRPSRERWKCRFTASLRVIGLEDFIAMKLFAHGPQDLEDARAALAAAAVTADFALLRKLATRFVRETGDALELLLRSVPNE